MLAKSKIPSDFRNQTFEQLRGRIQGLRSTVYAAWIVHGPGTTRAIAKCSGVDLLTFRPRTTELYQMGALCLVESEPGHSASEGIYRVRSFSEWQEWHAAQLATLDGNQMQLI